MTEELIPCRGNYRKLISYKKAEIIYDYNILFLQQISS